MKNKLLIAAAIILVFAAGVWAQNPKTVSIDTRITVVQIDPSKDYFQWSPDKNGKTVKDTFSAGASRDHDGALQTGASVAGSTENFNFVYTDKDGKTTMPQAIRHLMLYAVSAYTEVGPDNLYIIQNGKKLTIRFAHRNGAYQIETDNNGNINIQTACKYAVVCDSVAGAWIVKSNCLKTNGDKTRKTDIDWDKVPLAAQTATSTTTKYKGTLAAAYSNGVLTIKGNLTL